MNAGRSIEYDRQSGQARFVEDRSPHCSYTCLDADDVRCDRSFPLNESVPTHGDMPCKNTEMQSRPVSDPAVASKNVDSEAQKTTTTLAATAQTPGVKVDAWKTYEVLEMCFPAIAPAMCIALEQYNRKAESESSCTLVDLASM